MSKKLLVFAQRGEAAATLRVLKAEPFDSQTRFVWSEGNVPCYYAFEHGWIAISSVGIHAAQMTVAEYAQNIGEVWNLGLAGALDGGLPLGEIVEIKSVGKYISSGTLDPLSQECVRSAIPHLDLDLGFPYNGGESLPFSLSAPGGRLISSDFPIHDAQHREYLSKTWDLVDMEGYGIAYAACYLGKKCRMWKIVSDFASPGGRELIRKNKARLSERIAEKIYEAIHESSPDP